MFSLYKPFKKRF